MLVPPAPAPAPKPARNGGTIALVVAIVVVVAAGVGVFLWKKPGGAINPPVTTTSTVTTSVPTVSTTTTVPPKPVDWAQGVERTWTQHFGDAMSGWGYGYGYWVLSQKAWVVGDMAALSGIDPTTGEIMWHLDGGPDGLYLCAQTLVGGKVVCLETDQSTDNGPWQACSIDPLTGEQQCLDLGGAVSLTPGWSVWWMGVATGDGAAFVRGQVADGDPYNDGVWSAALRIDVNPLKVQWTKVFAPGACGPDTSYTSGALDHGDGMGVTGNVFWYRGAWQGDVTATPFALDIRSGQSIFSSDICPAIAPVTEDTFIVPNGVQDGPVTLPGGGQVSFVHAFGGTVAYGSPAMSDGGIVDSDAVRPSVPVYYVPEPADDNGDVTQAKLGVLPGDSWNATMELQQFIAGGSGSYLNAAVSGNTIVAAGGAGQVVAIDYTTGNTQWSSTVPYEDLGYILTSEQAVFIVGNVVVVTTQGYGAFGQTTLLGLATGDQIAQMPGDAVVSADGTMFGVINGDADTLLVTRYVPLAGS